MKSHTEILVIGGGSVGVCSAYYLSATGREVTLVEKGEICSGCSYGNGGLVVPSHSIPLAAPGVVRKGLKWMLNPESPFYIRPRLDRELLSWLWKFRSACTVGHIQTATPLIREMNLASVALFDELAQIDGLDFCYEKKGTITVYKTAEGLGSAARDAEFLNENGILAEVIDAEQIQTLNPGVETLAVGGIHFPQDAHLVPDSFVKGLAQHAAQHGVEVHTSTEVLDIETSDGRVTSVKTTRGDFKADQVVLAGGSWSPELVRKLQLKLPIQAGKGHSITFKRPKACLTTPCSLGEARVGVTPMGDMLRFAGTLELSGLDFSIDQRRVKAILQAVPQYFPDLDAGNMEEIETWCGLRPCTPDGLPLLGRSQVYHNLIVAAGHAMIGISLGPITGKLVAELVAEEDPSIDLTGLSLERFA